ncbi:hypothetical protein K503DRAFT_236387 [Rhizopogon vinicolor AM-OR11-026]|uniref:Uncharacterized protein n=1 Tax=Rhizopogon vinicolor AM-OR11-026 TaxID=1314800 RepID=A0A1B7MXW6_9AGAM|nr:hypothetical protein K503DRAFT_236387 [Rhizopogon vinicolor AM-OR11-026]
MAKLRVKQQSSNRVSQLIASFLIFSTHFTRATSHLLLLVKIFEYLPSSLPSFVVLICVTCSFRIDFKRACDRMGSSSGSYC